MYCGTIHGRKGNEENCRDRTKSTRMDTMETSHGNGQGSPEVSYCPYPPDGAKNQGDGGGNDTR